MSEGGVDPGLIRLSVGCEDLEDLLADLKRGLDAIAPPTPSTTLRMEATRS